MKWIYRHPRLYNLLDSLISVSLSDRVRSKVLRGLRPATLLEVGIGSGRCLDHIRADFVVGVDISEPMLTFLRRRRCGIGLVIADAHGLPFKQASFDVTIFCYCLAGLARPIEAVRQALATSSRVIIIDYNRPRIMPRLIWRWIVRGVGGLIFGSSDIDFDALVRLGRARTTDFYLGLYRVVFLVGVCNA